MILDRSHRPWIVATAIALGVATAAYVVYAAAVPGGPRGGTVAGLAFGIAAALAMAGAALLGVRKRRPHYRIGRASTWLKGHLWLGVLSLPLVLFHAGFAFGGTLATVLMWLLFAVLVTGAVTLALQHFLPRVMTRSLPEETVFEQLDHMRKQLLIEAEQMVRGWVGGVGIAKCAGRLRGRVVLGRAASTATEASPERAPLRLFLDRYLRPYFAADGMRRSRLGDPSARAALFEELRGTVDASLHGLTRDLEALCVQREQLQMQRRLHLWLHGWLLLHVPLSYLLVLLTAVHAVMSLYY